MTDLAALADQLEWPDHEAATKAHDALVTRADLGRLTGHVEWLAGVQAQFPIRPIAKPRLIIVAADHEVASTGVTMLTRDHTTRTLAAIASGRAPICELAERAGASIRVDAIDPASAVIAAIERGAIVADTEIDSGSDLLIVGNVGAGSTTTAAAVVSILTGTEPIKVVGRGGSGIDDIAWMHKVAAVRDARRHGWRQRGDPAALLTTLASADLGLLAGILVRAAARRTPVLLDGVVAAAAALVADRAKPGARRWWRQAQLTGEPALAIVLNILDMAPMLDLAMAAGDGRGGLIALELLRAAHVLSAAPGGSSIVDDTDPHGTSIASANV